MPIPPPPPPALVWISHHINNDPAWVKTIVYCSTNVLEPKEVSSATLAQEFTVRDERSRSVEPPAPDHGSEWLRALWD